MKKSILAAMAVLVFSGMGVAQTAKQHLDALSKKFESLSSFKADFEYKLTNSDMGLNEQSSGTVFVKGDMFKIDMKDVAVYNNGKTEWRYLKEDKEVNEYEVDPEDENMQTPKKIANLYKSGYKYYLGSDETVDGVACTVVDLSPDLSPEEMAQEQVFKIRIYIDKKTKMIKEWKVFERNGNRYVTTVKNIQTNASIPDSTFSFDAKKFPGVRVVKF